MPTDPSSAARAAPQTMPKPARLLLLLSFLAFVAGARADNVVLRWNEEGIDATRLSRNPPPMSSLIFATYQVAIFDTVNSFTRTYHGWLVDDPAPEGASMDAAVAGAANTVLRTLWAPTSNPANMQAFLVNELEKIPDGKAKDDGIAWGEKVAKAILAKRSTSGFDKPIPGKYSSTDSGKWRETPSAFRPPLLPSGGT